MGDAEIEEIITERKPRVCTFFSSRRRRKRREEEEEEECMLIVPIFEANLNDLRKLIEAGESANTLGYHGRSLLNFTMLENRVENFDYLLSLDEIDVNLADERQETPLMLLASTCFNKYFARRLIDKGADIHYVDQSGSTFLWYLADRTSNHDNLSIGRLAIEKGADINHQNYKGLTPLYSACVAGNFDWICMLLYYGADVTIATNRGKLPLVSVSRDMPEHQRSLLEEILFNCTFDDDRISVSLTTLVEAMTNDSDLFSKMFGKVSDVDYDFLDVQYMSDKLLHIKPKHLEIFMTRFSHIIQEMIDDSPPLDKLIDAAWGDKHKLQGIITFFLESDYAADFVQRSVPGKSVIENLLRIYDADADRNPSIYKEDFTKSACLMLTYGLTVTSRDLDFVYERLGYCELFQILLHMDFEMIVCGLPSSGAALYYNPVLTLENFLGHGCLYGDILDHFNDSKYKKILQSYYLSEGIRDDPVLDKINSLPQVPLLVELSRNAARKYIVDRFNAKKSVHFYTILKWLPIGDVNRSIIAHQKLLHE